RDTAVQRSAGQALTAIGPGAAPALLGGLMHEHRGVRFASARLLSEVEPSSPAGVPVLIDGLKGSNRFEARVALTRVGGPAVEAVAGLLSDANPNLRREAADILRDMGPRAAPAAAALVKAVADEDELVRLAAIRALGQNGPGAKETVLSLLGAHMLADYRLRQEIVETVAQIGPDAVPTLVAALGHPDRGYRAAAASGLAQMGTTARPALEALVAATKDEVPLVRWEAARALVPLDQRDLAVPVLAEGLRNRDYHHEALRTLLQCGPAGRVALIAALKDKDEVVRGE